MVSMGYMPGMAFNKDLRATNVELTQLTRDTTNTTGQESTDTTDLTRIFHLVDVFCK